MKLTCLYQFLNSNTKQLCLTDKEPYGNKTIYLLANFPLIKEYLFCYFLIFILIYSTLFCDISSCSQTFCSVTYLILFLSRHLRSKYLSDGACRFSVGKQNALLGGYLGPQAGRARRRGGARPRARAARSHRSPRKAPPTDQQEKCFTNNAQHYPVENETRAAHTQRISLNEGPRQNCTRESNWKTAHPWRGTAGFGMAFSTSYEACFSSHNSVTQRADVLI